MQLKDNFLQSILNSLSSHLVILDRQGKIIAVNEAWNRFANDNGLCPTYCGPGVDYRAACYDAQNPDPDGQRVAGALEEITAGRQAHFYYEYPCHSPVEDRWFSLHITRFESEQDVYIVIAHDNITQRKLAELEVTETNQVLEQLSVTDPLTGVSNRRALDERIQTEWNRHLHEQCPLAIAMIDIDCFKQYNDHYGHHAGDDVITKVAQRIKSRLDENVDFVARFGGEEFVVVLPNSDLQAAVGPMRRVLESINELRIPHEHSQVTDCVTVSIGLAVAIPDQQGTAEQLIQSADQALYQAKSTGRNRLAIADVVADPQGQQNAANETTQAENFPSP